MHPLFDLLTAGSPKFLQQLDAVLDAPTLRRLARVWYTDTRPLAREFLRAYLGRRLNPFHEPLVVRLFRRAYRAQDDEAMGWFLLLLDRGRVDMRPLPMPRGLTGSVWVLEFPAEPRVLRLSPEEQRAMEAYQVFAEPTRRLLQRRACGYFARVARERPADYIATLWRVLPQYTARETAGKHLRQCRCMFHLLLNQSAGHALWEARPNLLLDLITTARSRFVRRWAGHLFFRDGRLTAEQLMQSGLAPERVLLFLRSGVDSIREIGWQWFRLDPRLHYDTDIWRKLAESLDEDGRARFCEWLRSIQNGQPRVLRDALPLDAFALRMLWARVLLTVYGKIRTRLLLAESLVNRIEWQPDDTVHLLPMLLLILRRTEGPAWRAALVGVVTLVERQPAWAEVVRRDLPELELEVSAESLDAEPLAIE